MSCQVDFANCSAANVTSTDCDYLDVALNANCTTELQTIFEDQYNLSNCTSPEVNLERGFTVAVIFVLSLIGNVSIIAILLKFKVHKIPDVLVIGLAITDLIATVIPVPMSTYAYFAPYEFRCGEVPCDLYATVAQFTRYSSALIVTLVSLERYFAVNCPFFYRKHATPGRFVAILIICWIAAFALAVAPALDSGTLIIPHEGFCLFDVASPYAISIIVYSVIQYVVVFFCFVMVSVQLLKVYRRRKQLRVQDKYNKASKAQDREVTFTKPNLTSRISDLSKSLKKAAPLMVEKFQFGVEAQFAGMLFAVVLLFYISWTAILVIIIIAQYKNSREGLETALFWGIRLSIISAAINPLLYGILARQYRLAYLYVFRLCLSKCCRCIAPPLKDIFASARAPGGDVRNNRTVSGNRRRRFKEQGRRNGTLGSASKPESLWSRATSGLPVLTRTTGQTRVSLQGELEVIQEVDYLYSPNESTIDEHSTFIPSVGELASSVIIPHQKRDKNSSETDLNRHHLRQTASLDNLGDGLLSDFGISDNHQPGVLNPIVTELNENMSLSEHGSELESIEKGFQVGRLYSNPVYQIEVARKNEDGTFNNQREAMLAVSSADDITLLSKKGMTTRSVNIPSSSNSNNNNTLTPEEQRVNNSQVFSSDRSHTLPFPGRKVWSKSSDALVSPVNSHVSIAGQNGGVGVSSNENLQMESERKSIRPKETQLEQLRRLQQKQNVSRSQDFEVVVVDDRKRNSLNFVPDSVGGVRELRMRFESSSPTPPTSPPTQAHTSGRHNSAGNSDSGRESMVLEPDMQSS